MDWAVWDQTVDQESGSMGREWQCDFYFGYGIDVIEENAVNEKSCIQVLQVLISKANVEILELEEDLIHLQSQLAWADEAWSETCSSVLNGKIDCLDLSLRSLENADEQDEHEFCVCLLFQKEPAEKMHQIVKPLLENYFHQEHEQISSASCSDASKQANSPKGKNKASLIDSKINGLKEVEEHNTRDTSIVVKSALQRGERELDISEINEQIVNSVASKEDLSLETEKKGVADEDKNERTIIKDLSSNASGQETDESSGRKDLSKFDSQIDGKDGLRKHNSASKERCLVVDSTLKTAGKGRILPRSFEPTVHYLEFRSGALHEDAEEYDVNPKLSEGLDSALTKEIDPPLSSLMIGKKRTKPPRKMKSPDVGLTDTERKAVDSLLVLLNHKEKQKGKFKVAASVGDSDSNLPPKPQKKSAKCEYRPKQKTRSILDGDKGEKRKLQSLPGFKATKKLKSLQISVAKMCANATANVNVENLGNTLCSFTANNETPKLLPSPILPFPEARVLDLESLTLVDLRAIAKQHNMRGYTLLNKSKLTEELSLKLMVRGGCT